MIIAIIQARMSSTRLPGKVMKKILGRPMIFYLLERLKYSQKIDKIVVATTNKKADDLLTDYVKNQGVDVFRGSENDVLKRIYQAALAYKAKDIVWITADCPLIVPKICDKLINFYLKKKVDFAYLGSRFAEGLDCGVLSFKALKKSFQKASLKSEHEHLSLYIRNHPKVFRIATLENKTDDSKYRIAVDKPEDFKVVKDIFKALYKKDSPLFSFTKIKQFLDQHSEIMAKNMNIIRNEGLLITLKKDKRVK